MMKDMMAPLFVPRRPSDPPLFGELERHMATYFQAGIFGSTEVHVVARLIHRIWPRLNHRGGRLDGELAVALALAVRAPNHSHICVDLSRVSLKELLGVRSQKESANIPPLPENRAAWIAALSTITELVRGPYEDRITPFVLDGTWLYMDRSWRYQGQILKKIAAWHHIENQAWSEQVLAGLDILFRPPMQADEPETDLNRQRLAAAMALQNRLTVITGGPGMGKTWTVRNLIALLYLEHAQSGEDGPPQIALAAPTGKAAVRIRESLLEGITQEFVPTLERFLSAEDARDIAKYVSDIQASTLHRLLGVRAGSSSRFYHHQDAPLPYDTIIVDEVSMVDFRMMAKLVDAVSDRSDKPTRLILLGDRDQLASVEAGTVLADLCGPTTASTIRLSQTYAQALPQIVGIASTREAIEWSAAGMDDKVIQFNQTYRFGADSGIKRFADACVSAPFDRGVALGALADDQSSDTELIEYGPNGIPRKINDLVRIEYRPYLELLHTNWRDEPDRFPTEAVYHRRLLERFDSFRILCAFKRGRTGVDGMNERVTRALATHPVTEIALEPREEFWEGRPIMVTRNDYSVGRYNGDIGIVVSRLDHEGQSRLFVAFPGQDSLPSESKLADRGHDLEENEYDALELVKYLQVNRLPDHETVFAMTIHKSQGSQFGHVMVVLPNQPERTSLLTRELIYTGVTRASRRVTVLSNRELLADTLAMPIQRASQLGVKLWDPDE